MLSRLQSVRELRRGHGRRSWTSVMDVGHGRRSWTSVMDIGDDGQESSSYGWSLDKAVLHKRGREDCSIASHLLNQFFWVSHAILAPVALQRAVPRPFVQSLSRPCSRCTCRSGMNLEVRLESRKKRMHFPRVGSCTASPLHPRGTIYNASRKTPLPRDVMQNCRRQQRCRYESVLHVSLALPPVVP
ncbi:hypothetical protein GQ53DRAFT_28097 [Thozetella sp. PMI_491]|nr:hypothetical protein GQ53DRAFT_28097 [Thozetella sp. PMI_491]